MKKNVYNFWQWVDVRMEQVGISSYRELEARSGFTNGAIGKRRNTDKFPTVEMAEGMCRALDVSWFELWKQAGFTTDSQLEVGLADEQEMLDIFRSLAGARRNAALDMMRGMRARPSTPEPARRALTVQDLPAEPLMEPEAMERALDWWSKILAEAPAVTHPILARLLHVAANWYERGRDVEQLMNEVLGDEAIVASIRRRIEEALQEREKV